MALMSLRSRSHIKASMVLMRADHLFIYNYIKALLNNILIPIIMVGWGLDYYPTACVADALSNWYIYIYIYI